MKFFEDIGKWFENNWVAILITLAVIILGFIIVKIILAIVRRQLAKTKIEKTIQSFVLSILKFVLYLILIFAIISSLGISITGLTVVFSAVSLAISLALQDSLKNLVNGFIVITTSILKQGDWVQIGDKEGSVVDVRMLYTILKTADNKKIYIPNTTVMSGSVVNFNTLGYRRVDLDFTISYDSNVDKAKEIVKEVFASCEMVYEDPAPSVVLSNLGESSITLTAKVWCSSADYWDTKWYLIDNIFNEFKRNNINIPFNQLEVALVDPNKKSYVRKEALKEAAQHKQKPGEEEDILSAMGKGLHINKKTDKKEKKNKKEDKKNKKNKEEVIVEIPKDEELTLEQKVVEEKTEEEKEN